LAHSAEEKQKLLARINRIQGQMEGIKKAVGEEQDCSLILQQIAACRGAINGLMSEIIEGEVLLHVLSRNAKANSTEAHAANALIKVLRTYLK
jgi:DNA-binding FrmR family transcriptional regulator